MDYTIHYQNSLSLEEEKVLIDGLAEEAFLKKSLPPIEPFAFVIRTQSSEMIGGLKGFSYYGCFYIDSLWVSPLIRHQGFGSKLMEQAEELAKKRSCSFISLTTMDWEALPFYQKRGYHIEYTREGYDKNSKMHILRKDLWK